MERASFVNAIILGGNGSVSSAAALNVDATMNELKRTTIRLRLSIDFPNNAVQISDLCISHH